MQIQPQQRERDAFPNTGYKGLPFSQNKTTNSHTVNNSIYLEHKDSTVTVIFLLWNTLKRKKKMVININQVSLHIRKLFPWVNEQEMEKLALSQIAGLCLHYPNTFIREAYGHMKRSFKWPPQFKCGK